MGAWAEDAFGNDTACDWAGGFSDDPCIEKVEEAIRFVSEAEEYLESDEASEALAACEIVARLKGNWGVKNAYSESIDKWVESTSLVPGKDLISKAENAIIRILGENSELQELWEEDGENEQWRSEMNGLLERIKS